MASVRKSRQAVGIERSTSTIQEYMKAKHWPAKQVICVEILVSLRQSCFGGPPSGEESAPDGAEQAAAPGVVGHIVVAAPWRGEEAASMDFSCMTHISRSFHAILCTLSSHTTKNIRAILRRTVSCISIAIYHFGERVFGAPCRVHDADCELHHL